MSHPSEFLSRQVLQAIEAILEKSAGEHESGLMLGEPPLSLAEGVRIRSQTGPPLADRKGSGYLQMKTWPRQALNANGFPTLLFVTEGEAHFRIGLTRKMIRRQPEAGQHAGYYIIEVKAPHCLLLPAGVPYSDATRPHWEREDKSQANSWLLWINVLPETAIFHLCRTQEGEHTSTNALMVPDQHLFTLTCLMLDEMRAKQEYHQESAQSLLRSLLLRAARGLVSHDAFPANDVVMTQVQGEWQQRAGAHHIVELDRACRYINGNLGKPLTTEAIATQAFVSATQLKRLFRRELDTSVMRYVKQQRMESACFYLRSSQMLIQEIAENLGYSHVSQFSRDFACFTGSSPRSYRNNIKAGA